MTLLTLTNRGLYCPKGNFYIDPNYGVSLALITHGHSDHARRGSRNYISSKSSVPIIRHRLGNINIEGIEFGKKLRLGDVWVSFHPANHVLGSAQIRFEGKVNGKDSVWVVSGDYKVQDDPSCESFELVPCDVFITEATFALPIYHWQSGEVVAKQIYDWWQDNRDCTSVLQCYSLGKAQRVLAELAKLSDEVVYLDKATFDMTEIYRDEGISLIPTKRIVDQAKDYDFVGDLVLAASFGNNQEWLEPFHNPQVAFASGWMMTKRGRMRRSFQKGFVMSDHVDWNGLINTIKATGASRVYATHGQDDVLARYLQESLNIEAYPLDDLKRPYPHA